MASTAATVDMVTTAATPATTVDTDTTTATTVTTTATTVLMAITIAITVITAAITATVEDTATTDGEEQKLIFLCLKARESYQFDGLIRSTPYQGAGKVKLVNYVT